MRTSILAVSMTILALSASSCRAETPADAPKPPSDLGVAGRRTFYRGQTDARRDIAHNRLIIQASVAFGSPSAALEKLLHDRYKIEIEIVSTDEISDEELGYKEGYNGISIPEIERRYGKGILDRIYTESERKGGGH